MKLFQLPKCPYLPHKSTFPEQNHSLVGRFDVWSSPSKAGMEVQDHVTWVLPFTEKKLKLQEVRLQSVMESCVFLSPFSCLFIPVSLSVTVPPELWLFLSEGPWRVKDFHSDGEANHCQELFRSFGAILLQLEDEFPTGICMVPQDMERVTGWAPYAWAPESFRETWQDFLFLRPSPLRPS